MTLQNPTKEDLERLIQKVPPGIWDKIKEQEAIMNKIRKVRKIGDTTEIDDEYYRNLYKLYGITKQEVQAISFYKSPSSEEIQRALRNRRFRRELLSEKPLTDLYFEWARKAIPHIDSLIAKHRVPHELSGQRLYRGTRIDYGTSIIRSGKKPGDMIRDPRYQSFSINPQTAMFHTSRSQFGDLEGEPFRARKKVLLEHIVKGGEPGMFGGSDDSEMEVIYPRDKRWKITGIRDEKFKYDTYENEPEQIQNVRIYTIERKKKKTVKKKPLRRKKVIKRKPDKRCKCK
jgi:hypothetical protein